MNSETAYYNLNCNTEITYLKGVGPRRGKVLIEHGITTIGDLLHYFPRRYIDRSRVIQMNHVKVGEEALVVGNVQSCGLRKTRKRNYYQVNLEDGRGTIQLIWFHALSWIVEKFTVGDLVAAYGKVDFYNGFKITHPEFDILDKKQDPINTGQIIPVYPGTSELKSVGLESRGFRKIIWTALEKLDTEIPDIFPEKFTREYGLIPKDRALSCIHQPEDMKAVESARYRLKFDEHFFLQLLMALRRNQSESTTGRIFDEKGPFVKRMYEKLPFELTNAQIRVLREIRSDLISDRQMNRLLQGDVGSGKTVVAMLIASIVVGHGAQVAVLAPTEILAEQHYRSFKKYCELVEISCSLLTGSIEKNEKQVILENLESGKLQLIVGTHALIQENVVFKDLGLIIVDEQHRFGVKQRKKLIEKGYTPEILAMTATPIPRTLAITYHGDLDVSIIDELPKNRREITTRIVSPQKIEKVYGFIKDLVNRGQQCFIVYPVIEDSENVDIKAAKSGYDMLKNTIFPEYSLGYIDGRMKVDERNTVMESFANNDIQVLVSTTVIEVGIDVPNATVMVIENAERFGLSQLHQLRGRTGRGTEKSYCILVERKSTPESEHRLKVISETNDGFKISDEDLKLRGPGEFFGKRQHGYMKMKIGNILTDGPIIRNARQAAFSLITKDPHLQQKEHHKIREQFIKDYSDMLEFVNIS